VGGIDNSMMSQIRSKDEKAIREKFKEIDDILTRECLFCGSILIDMIDNDIEQKDEDLDGEFEEQESPDTNKEG